MELVEVEYRYPRGLRDKYRHENEFDHWFVKYFDRYPFRPSLLRNRQIPHAGLKPRDALFFNELFMATQYLDAGYEALVFYRSPNENESSESYDLAKKLIGDAYDSILRLTKGGEPDLLVYKPGTHSFRFVECKGRGEPFTESQIEQFPVIRDSLTNCPPPCRVPLSDSTRPLPFPPLKDGDWIHVAQVAEEP